MNQQLCIMIPAYAASAAAPERALTKGGVNARCWLT